MTRENNKPLKENRLTASQLHIDRQHLSDLCHKWRITELSLFGSVLRDDFGPESDIDILVAFENDAAWSLFDLVELREEFMQLFGREVDLVEKGTIRNPFRRHAIMQSREVLYAA
jgi:predicted nucleotidyltransferase